MYPESFVLLITSARGNQPWFIEDKQGKRIIATPPKHVPTKVNSDVVKLHIPSSNVDAIPTSYFSYSF